MKETFWLDGWILGQDSWVLLESGQQKEQPKEPKNRPWSADCLSLINRRKSYQTNRLDAIANTIEMIRAFDLCKAITVLNICQDSLSLLSTLELSEES